VLRKLELRIVQRREPAKLDAHNDGELSVAMPHDSAAITVTMLWDAARFMAGPLVLLCIALGWFSRWERGARG